MRLLDATIKNFRGFEDFSVEFDGESSVLVGANGSGKTSLVRVLGIVTHSMLGPLGQTPGLDLDAQSDMRARWKDREGRLTRELAGDIAVETRMEVDGTVVRPSLYASLSGQTFTSANPDEISVIRRKLDAGDAGILPIFGIVRAHRMASSMSFSGRPSVQEDKLGRTAGYRGSNDIAGNLANVAQWLVDQHYVRLDRLYRAGSSASPSDLHPQLTAVQRAAGTLVDGAQSITFDPDIKTMVVDLGDTRIPFSLLSDGYRTLVSIGLSLVWQAVILNPQFGAEAPLRSPGIVFIDELELHLHPAWQWQILRRLQAAFPLVQFIVTTHSPTVVAAAPAHSVRVLTEREALRADGATGKDVNSVLREIFGTQVRPAETTRQLEILERMLDSHDTAGARQLVGELEHVLGADDPDLIRARWTLRLRERMAHTTSES